ncbi:MAG: pyrimidine-nucleoside phosphorylase [Paenibacillaceae bacterium]|nr:pyrimidine-nucleoside phosphorylase [Paenibacillaceae bacterium]
MNMVELIRKKRRGEPLMKEEIGGFIAGYTRGDIPDYQASALLMAICFRGMDARETADLTLAMADSGDRIDLSAVRGVKVDKHSTGGVGDKISFVVAPLVAAAGIPVAKMSGRGLGHTGGTIDKLESIPGFRTELPNEQFLDNVNRYGMAIVGQTGNLAPADKKLYALRDVTGTVDSIPLIASSVMSKKIASGADCIVLDVKTGSGAFMKTAAEARQLAEAMVAIGKSLGRRTVAVISDMNEPLGREVGNANEIREAIATLRGEGPADIAAISLALASQMAVLGGAFPDYGAAHERLAAMLASGEALAVFRRFVLAQGGDAACVDRPELLPQAKRHIDVRAAAAGYVAGIDAEAVGLAAMALGAGRRRKDDAVDHAAGVTLLRKTGERVEAGDTLCVMHTNGDNAEEAARLLERAYTIGADRPAPREFILDTVR